MTQAQQHDRCPHFGECGGCQTQDVPYAEQLTRKAADLEQLFAEHWARPIPVHPSPTQWHYRNKLDFTFGRKYYDVAPPKDFPRETVLGFKKKGRWFWPLEIDECRLGSPEIAPLLAAVKAWVSAQGLEAFHGRSGTGLLKILLVRECQRTDQRMVVLVTRPGDLDTASFVQAVRAAYPATSIYWGESDSSADVAFAESLHLLYGREAIDEELHLGEGPGARCLHFRISPFSFFQTNSLATERLYGLVRRHVSDAAPEVLYDLYGGAGGIAFSCADTVRRVISVESVEFATLDGRANAARNAIENVEFITQPVEAYLRDCIEQGGLAPGAYVVCDPPRSGLHPKALRRLIALRPPEILYVSCKPSVLAGELESLREGYALADLQAIDLFPHTGHVEVLARLTAKAL